MATSKSLRGWLGALRSLNWWGQRGPKKPRGHPTRAAGEVTWMTSEAGLVVWMCCKREMRIRKRLGKCELYAVTS